MKKVLLLTFAMISLSAMAQEKQKSERPHYTPEQRATLQTKKMTLALDLSTTQQDQVLALELEQAKINIAAMEKRKAHKIPRVPKNQLPRNAMPCKCKDLIRRLPGKAK